MNSLLELEGFEAARPVRSGPRAVRTVPAVMRPHPDLDYVQIVPAKPARPRERSSRRSPAATIHAAR